ncbi:MAG TPA: hypothetical protein VG826_03755 [Pirellulales bacterium]|nr:hypothetical protein [Pirellulales bacterium]
MTLTVNKGNTEVLPIKPCFRDRRRLGRQLAPALMPITPPNGPRELVGGRLTLPQVFLVLVLTFMVGCLIWCLLREPSSSLSMLWPKRFS